ncbi:MAG TPA: hypothetical protein VGM19_00290 [Armatimonadota bacterium]|jgi:hypothetical protein
MIRTLVCLLAAAAVSLVCAAGNLLQSPDFSSFGTGEVAWVTSAKTDGVAEAGAGRDGAKGLHLKAASAAQLVQLPAGLYELTVWASGAGDLRLGASDAGDRWQSLNKTGGLYGYLFQTTGGAVTITVGCLGDGVVSEASLLPATAEQQTAWDQGQQSLVQFGWIAVSPQRPTPGAAPLEFAAAQPLPALTRWAVLDEPRIDLSYGKNLDRALQWLGENGFERLDGAKLAAWMQARVAAGDAYGSVVLLCRGVSPLEMFEGPQNNPLWLQYLKAGGRIVNAASVPLYYAQPSTVEPVSIDVAARGLGLLGLEGGWSSPYWGQNLPTTITPAGKAWGLESFDGSIIGFAVEALSIPFDTYVVPATGKLGSATWFKNVAPDKPWSGLLKFLYYFDGNNDSNLRDVWRATHYVGQPVTIPPLPAAAVAAVPQIVLNTLTGLAAGQQVTPGAVDLTAKAEPAAGMRDRWEWVRGEQVTLQATPAADLQATSVRLVLQRAGQPVWAQAQPVQPTGGKPGAAWFVLPTAGYAYGAYELKATALRDTAEVGSVTQTVGVRFIAPEYFNWEAWIGASSNAIRTDLQFADLAQHGMEVYLTGASAAGVDACVRNGLGFSLRGEPDLTGTASWTFEKNPDHYRLDPQGKPLGNPYTAGRPGLGISHPDVLANLRNGMAAQVRTVAGIPAFRPYVICNDDWSIYYGWDYQPSVVARFKADTGLDAPREMKPFVPAKFGAIPDDNAWVNWFRWTLINLDGAANRAETEGCRQVRADVRCGPIPGGMQIPLIQLWEPSQYPPYNFGKHGFNLLCSYYYNTYWQPVMTSSYWMEIGRMGNRDLPEWNMPDSFMTAGYTRNNLFHYLAGGVSGLAYFTYDSRNDNTWPEFGKLGAMLKRVGPVQAALKPARRDIGMLNSFTTNCFDAGHDLVQVYGYHNLKQAHYSVDMICEEEVTGTEADRYKAILLYNVKYLPQAVYDALAARAKRGQLVLLDKTIPFDIPGAKRVATDIGMGDQTTLGMPPEGAHLSVPGLKDYGRADRIAVIAKALAPFVKPGFESTDIKLAAWDFAAGGVPYQWYVNVHDGDEYMFCRERMGAGQPGSGTPEKVQELRAWEQTEMAKGPYTTTIIVAAPGGGARVPYDLVGMKKVPAKKLADGRYELTLSMERFGGELIAWLPEEVQSVRLSAPAAKLGQPWKATATIMGGKPAQGILAVAYTLTDPAGQVSPVSGVRQATTGTAALDWTPAGNDPVGAWTVTAQELVTGKTAKTTFKVGK